MAEKEELDNTLVELFIKKEVYKTYQEKYENGKSPYDTPTYRRSKDGKYWTFRYP